MSSVVVDIFCEDAAHELFLRALVGRLAREARETPRVNTRSARGGKGRSLGELKKYADTVKTTFVTMPDVLVAAIDTNCDPWTKARDQILSTAGEALRDRTVPACPDPHVERWYLADPVSFHRVIGTKPVLPRKPKCGRGEYKAILRKAIKDAGHPLLQGGIEFAAEIVAAMDLHRAARNDGSLSDFLDTLRNRLRW